MKFKLLSVFFLMFYTVLTDAFITIGKKFIGSTPADGGNFVVTSTESTKETGNATYTNNSQVNPQIYSMQIHANISNRFARTLITSKVRNLKNTAEGTTFSVILPENGFISAFEMEIEGKIYKAYVKEKEEAKKIYEQAVSRGRSAAHVELSARDSKTFAVSVNIEPESKTIFKLVYEELLERQIGQYELIINIHPGQPVEDLGVEIRINESRPLTFVRSPSLRTGNEISKNDETLDPEAEIEILNSTAIVKFSPDLNQQKTFAENLGGKKENGLAGQFVVQYDVARDPQGGEVLVRDGYFVHFFAPSELEPLPKHVVFVLDYSGSMSGRKIDQVIEAMQNILSELKTKDLFDVVRFADEASVWNVTENKFVTVSLSSPQYGHLEPHLKESNLPQAVEANEENIQKAKNVVKDTSDMGLTNIIAGLEIGLFLTKRTQENIPNKYQPMIIFLTDGFPNVGLHSRDQITDTVTKLNSDTNRAAIFSLSFGAGADKDFLRKLSSKNLGFSRNIYEAADASLQLQKFYRQISSPLLSNIAFKYVDGVSDVTKAHYPILFKGSELVVAGRTGDNPNILLNVNAVCTTGPVVFNTTRTEPISSLERLWAYLTVKEILNERESASNTTELTKKALDLALKYSFVTSVSSLVVVKPNQTHSIDGHATEPETAINQHFPSSGGRLFTTFGKSPPGIAFGPTSGVHYFTTTTMRAQPQSTTTTASPSQSSSDEWFPILTFPIIPDWLEILKNNNENITTPQGSFKLGQSGAVVPGPECSETPINGTTGVCTIIFDCPKVFSLLTDIDVYLEYFCPLNKYAGICCPVNTNSLSTIN